MATLHGCIRSIFVLLLVTATFVMTSSANLTITATGQPGRFAWMAAKQGRLTATPGTLRFGRVAVGQTMSLNTTLTNTQATEVTISDLTQSGAGFSAIGLILPLTLAAGQSVPLSVSFSPQAGGRVMGNITLTSDASNKTLVLYLQGAGATAGTLAAAPSSLSFGNVPVGKTQTLSATLTNSGNTSITVTQVMTVSPDFSLSGLSLPLTLTAMQSFTFETLFAPQSAGNASDNISVISNASDSTLNIPLSGVGMPAAQLAISPTGLAFGDVATGASKALSAILAASGSSVTVTSATTGSTEFILSGISFPATIAAGQNLPVTMTFAPQDSGSASASASFVSNAGNSPTMETLTGNGTAQVSHNVTLTWDSTGSGVVGFYIYRGGRMGGPYTKINPETESSPNYTDTSVQSGQTYYYVTTAVDGGGTESSYSNEIRVLIPKP